MNIKKKLALSVGSLLLVGVTATAMAKSWVDITIPIKDIYSDGYNLGFRDANTNNFIAIRQFVSNCDLTLIHANNERRDHCNNDIKVRITGNGAWYSWGLYIDEYLGCGIVNDSWENKCVAASSSTSTSTSSSSTSSSSSSTGSSSSTTSGTTTSTTSGSTSTSTTVNELIIKASQLAPVKVYK